jgi:hypothetical protein
MDVPCVSARAWLFIKIAPPKENAAAMAIIVAKRERRILVPLFFCGGRYLSLNFRHDYRNADRAAMALEW